MRLLKSLKLACAVVFCSISRICQRAQLYCFANTEILQVGSYTGNGLSDGPFVSLPFKPAMTLIKRISGGSNNWYIHDNTRDPVNPVRHELYADIPDAEYVYHSLDYCSNGFKIISGGAGTNAFNSFYLYLAISETPFKYSRGR